MSIRQISLNNFRNLRSTTLDLDRHFNIITGINASGKSNFLEALHILCQGQSFRTTSIDKCTQHSKTNFLLFAVFDNYKAGISRANQQTTIRINNESISKVSLLAEKTPIRIINSTCFNLLTGSPKNKREYIDWCLFHVEHSYISLWLEHRHALKQRNALLKIKRNLDQLDYWDEHLSKLCIKIYKLRYQYIEEIKKVLNSEFSDILNNIEISINYEQGWNINGDLLDILLKDRDKDIKYGFTHHGVHRDDIKILSHSLPIQDVLSRGQLKTISIILYLAQILIVKKQTNKSIILLIDDLLSELDDKTANLIIKKLQKFNLQIFITSIGTANSSVKYPEEFTMFHVEHGMIKAVKN